MPSSEPVAPGGRGAAAIIESVNSADFYRQLPPCRGFVEAAFDPASYRRVPDDWAVIVADIVASTRAVEAGRFAEVNYLGAACIVAVTNALPGCDLPSAFGGDGATLAVHGDWLDPALEALRATRRWGLDAFGLDLRVGAVEVAELNRRRAPLWVAKRELSPGNLLAMFRGPGFELADELIKRCLGKDPPPAAGSVAAPDLRHLSCRWSPMASENGRMLCLIVRALAAEEAEADRTYRRVLAFLDQRVGLEKPRSQPVKATNLRFRPRWSAVVKEAMNRGRRYRRHLPAVALWHGLIWLLLRFDIRVGRFVPAQYRHELTVNTDVHKVNGSLKLMLDCSESQMDSIAIFLRELREEGVLVYGMHESTHAIMTCVAPDVRNHRHLHYIDGGDGGYWNAARLLKRQLLESASAES